ncbi:MAG: cyclopropane fatty acyl phospholipid synthase [Pseudomonadota bacterium]
MTINAKKIIETILTRADIRINGDRPGDIQVHNERLYGKVLRQQSIGLGDAYMDKWWDCEDLDQFFYKLLSSHVIDNKKSHLSYIVKLVPALFLNFQSKKHSQKVADEHYNLDNTLFQHMLGPSMAYTCAYFKHTDHLDKAQYAKYDLVCRKVKLKPGEKVLELGCGWGSFAKYAAENYGCEIVSVNISEEQIKYAKTLCKNLENVEFFLCDYRDAHIYNNKNIKFDKVVSIGLCEHIGHKNYQGLMTLVKKQMKEDGVFLLHTIGGNASVKTGDPWLSKHIFPHGHIPSLKQLVSASQGTFALEDFHNFGTDYDLTLMAWYDNFKQHWAQLKNTYDERFYRMWRYYLLCCAAGFRARYTYLWQFVFTKIDSRQAYGNTER